MGRRRPKAAFIPDAYVLPGGRVEPRDRRAFPAVPLTAETVARVGDAAKARSTSSAIWSGAPSAPAMCTAPTTGATSHPARMRI